MSSSAAEIVWRLTAARALDFVGARPLRGGPFFRRSKQETCMLVKDKTVVVVGVGPGLGREVAAAALRDGANVVIAARRKDELAEAAKSLDPSGKRPCVSTDVTDDAQCNALMDAAARSSARTPGAWSRPRPRVRRAREHGPGRLGEVAINVRGPQICRAAAKR
jgi:NAD(P)-dependent dehydrogenase (short-subunit alcohol dehydrogenase family)